MILHEQITGTELRQKIRQGQICFGGNRGLKIYGKLDCYSGKKMKMANRVFFASEKEAVEGGYRPCGHCMREQYLKWKHGTICYPH
jgi:methylphosphotriester-DNA--protein-cysteine methyltransferase